MYKHIKKKLVRLWNFSVDCKINLINKCYLIKDYIISKFINAPIVYSIDDTIRAIVEQGCSMTRYGDGEFKLMIGMNIAFQQDGVELSRRLKEIIKVSDENFLVCLPDVFGNLRPYAEEVESYWKLHIAKYRKQWYQMLNTDMIYYNSFVTRFYYEFKDKSNSYNWLKKFKEVWKDRDVVMIEGCKSRVGWGNDLFLEARSVERILVPEKNAFNVYSQILEEAQKVNKKKLILLAIGPTATVLAYDLYKQGYQVLDIGHIDIEYEWLLQGVTQKVGIKNKYVNEVATGTQVEEINDAEYLKQIICTL